MAINQCQYRRGGGGVSARRWRGRKWRHRGINKRNGNNVEEMNENEVMKAAACQYEGEMKCHNVV